MSERSTSDSNISQILCNSLEFTVAVLWAYLQYLQWHNRDVFLTVIPHSTLSPTGFTLVPILWHYWPGTCRSPAGNGSFSWIGQALDSVNFVPTSGHPSHNYWFWYVTWSKGFPFPHHPMGHQDFPNTSPNEAPEQEHQAQNMKGGGDLWDQSHWNKIEINNNVMKNNNNGKKYDSVRDTCGRKIINFTKKLTKTNETSMMLQHRNRVILIRYQYHMNYKQEILIPYQS